ncbi:MAG: DUF1801 domain-containing protein [Armatimonadetes bacterium]|nr:DUF1801 domain-containing protein [Armatimonadota bacterium]
MKPEPTTNVDAYIAEYPESVQSLLTLMRETIKTADPEAEELISYGMPAYKREGILVYFAGCKNHIGFYPTASGIEAFKQELSGYKSSKGSVQFPLDEPLPLELITKIVQFRVAKNLEKVQAKKRS